MKIRSIKTKLFADIFALYFGRSLNMAIGLVSTLIYGIVFQKTEIAVISLFEMVVNLFVSFGFTWSTLALLRFGKEEILKHQSLNYTSSIRIGIVIPFLFSSICLIILFKNNILTYIGTKDAALIGYLIANLILLVIHEHIIYLLTTAENHVQNVVYYVSLSIGKICILLGFYFRLFDNLSAELYLKLNVYLFLGLLVFRAFKIRYKYMFPIVIGNKKDYKAFFSYVMPQIYGFTGIYVVNWVDLYFIKKYCSLDDLGGYQFLYSIFQKFCSLGILLNTVFFPRIMEWKITGGEKVKTYISRAPIYIMSGTVLIFVIFIGIYPPLFRIFFHNKYVVAYASFNILLLSLPFYVTTYLYIPVLNSYDRVKYIQNVLIFAASMNVVIDFLLIKYYGIIAAGLGTFLAFFSQFLLFSVPVERMFNAYSLFPKIVGAIVAIIVLTYFFHVTRISRCLY